MSRARNWESIELMKRKISMAQSIAKKDGGYALYAGANPESAFLMCLIDWAKEESLFSEASLPTIDSFRSLLEFQRKAFIATVSSEVTKLGFILGNPNVSKSAIKQ